MKKCGIVYVLALFALTVLPYASSIHQGIRSSIESGFDYGNVRWGMTVEEVHRALQTSGRTDIRELCDFLRFAPAYSFVNHASFVIFATNTTTEGVSFREEYFFREEVANGLNALLLCGIRLHARYWPKFNAGRLVSTTIRKSGVASVQKESVEKMLREQYGAFVCSRKQQPFKNTTMHWFCWMRHEWNESKVAIKTERVSGSMHSAPYNGIVSIFIVRLIPAWDDK